MSLLQIKQTVRDAARSIADLMPDGVALSAKNIKDSNLYNFLQAQAEELVRQQARLADVANYYIPTRENLERGDFYKDWILCYQIPDECWRNFSDSEITLNYLLCLLQNANVLYNRSDYVALGDFFGVVIEVTYNAPFDITVQVSEQDTPNRWPWTWPHTWSGGESLFNLLECLVYESTPMHIKLQVVRFDPTLVWENELGEPWENENGELWTMPPP